MQARAARRGWVEGRAGILALGACCCRRRICLRGPTESHPSLLPILPSTTATAAQMLSSIATLMHDTYLPICELLGYLALAGLLRARCCHWLASRPARYRPGSLPAAVAGAVATSHPVCVYHCDTIAFLACRHERRAAHEQHWGEAPCFDSRWLGLLSSHCDRRCASRLLATHRLRKV